ncbi:MAG: PilZ domain-containing protein [Candidatus Omnitrophica bacterium]|nr:PilZ domain-containing protein [Candidatus Omnitrophota bacterium]
MTIPRVPSVDERRRYKRLEHIFPVEFRFIAASGEAQGEWREAFTQDVSAGGLCLIVTQLNDADVARFSDPAACVALNINIPVGEKPAQATAHPAWMRPLKEGLVNQFIVGVTYERIEPRDVARIMRYADLRKFLKAAAIVFTITLSLGLVTVGFINARLRYRNEKLLGSLTDTLVRQRNLEKGKDLLELKIDEMQFLLSQSSRRIETLETALALTGRSEKKKIEQLEASLDFFKKYQDKLKEDLSGLLAHKARVDVDVTVKVEEGRAIEKKVVDKFYRWLGTHQNHNTGLVTSFEGDADIADWAFTYDQALAVVIFALFDDAGRARKVLDFYVNAARADGGGLTNAYYASNGDVAEYIAHAGPNIWLGIAIMHYTHHFGDRRYLGIAEEIFRWLDDLRDAEGGIRGGKTVTWYSTEHHLDAYAFYEMFHTVTGSPDARRKAEETLRWLGENAYSRISLPVVKRGKGDGTIATDTYAWSIAAVGPQKLKSIGMDPDEIINFAIDHCAVAVDFKKPEGYLVRVKGFDFAKGTNIGRGGVVSGEWTAQMILSLDIMADYHAALGEEEKAREYRRLANDYIVELTKMIITSPSPVGQGDFCLPYASHEFADTGHGWRTPKGNRTGSVAATAYTVLSMEGYNPLSLGNPPRKVSAGSSGAAQDE